jgi:DNA repair exonuclease SbcCD ATPase subunit
MIVFRNIKWLNFLSTGNYFTEIKLDNNQNTLIVGENGSGKSTLLDALCFVLFGKAFRNINKPQLLNSINQKDCVVEINFDTNSKSYKIVRGIKPNIFEIYCDGELLNQDAATRDYQEILEKSILKLNYKSFTQIVILGSASFTPFMQLSSSDRRSIIEDLLDIQIFSTMNNIVKDKISNNKDITSQKKHKIDLSQQKSDIQKKHIAVLKQNNDVKIKEYELEISNNTTTLSELQSNVEMLIAQTEKLQDFVSNKIETESKIQKITKLESQIESNLLKIKKDIVFFQSHDNCITCRQAIAQNFKEEELENLSTKALECEHGLSELEKKLLKEQEKMSEINLVQKTIQEKQVKIATNNATISELNKYNDKLQARLVMLNQSENLSEDGERELASIQNELSQLQHELKVLIEEKAYYEVASNLLKDTGIKTKIVKQYLPIINKLVNKYLASLDFFVNFNLDESFKETIKSRHRDDFSYNNFSEGEKQRIDMALMLTWRAVAKLKNSSNTNLLILDEVFDSSLDNNGTEYLMNILHMLEGTNLFVISHKGDILQDKFANVMRFQKVKNFSKMVTK